MNLNRHARPRLAAILLLLLGAIGGAIGGHWWARQQSGTPATARPPLDNTNPGSQTGSNGNASNPAHASGERKVLYWYDPMVPTQKFDHPGKSPFMDMQLVPRYAGDGSAAGAADSSERMTLPRAATQSLGLRLATVASLPLADGIDAVGSVQLNERDVSIVQARTSGFVQSVVAHAVGDVVAAGSPMAEVLNPEWAGAQQEYLALRRIGDAELTQAGRQRLVLLGMPEALIVRVEQGGKALPLTTIRAPRAGVISELGLRQGMTLASGMTLARINGLQSVWLELAVPEAQGAGLAIGQRVLATFPALAGSAEASSGATASGHITAILSETNRDTRTLRVRVELPNPGQRLRAGMSAQAHLQGAARTVLAVPLDAVIRTGKRTLVYLAPGGGQFQALAVQTGIERDGMIEIRHGLRAGQQIVVSGQFLLDSEASLRGLTVIDQGDGNARDGNIISPPPAPLATSATRGSARQASRAASLPPPAAKPASAATERQP